MVQVTNRNKVHNRKHMIIGFCWQLPFHTLSEPNANIQSYNWLNNDDNDDEVLVGNGFNNLESLNLI